MKIFAAHEIKKANRELNQINALSDSYKKLSDDNLKKKTEEFKKRLEAGETLDEIRVDVFATVREATWRVLKKKPFDVQVLGGLILDYGSVAEMKTGEGKTITSIAPVYLNALSGKGVIVSTVNEYLSGRDSTEMGEVYKWLGLTVGLNLRDMSTDQKREAYNCDITYSVHSEIGFDYLRDNMVKKIEEKVQRGFNFALIDEVDSILIDEARTPLIITGGSSNKSQTYEITDNFVKTLKKEDYEIDLESKSIHLTHKGMDKANKFFNLNNIFEMQNSELVHRISNALRANYIMSKDIEYIVSDNKILIVDAFTGRIMEGRSFSDGLHQALQAKEKVEIEPETITMATITYQNLFRMFKKLSGMSGTAKTEENEFIEIYNMRVHEISTNKPIKRMDHKDIVFVNASDKYKAIVLKVKELYKKGQPILLGTEEVSESEKLSKLIKKEKIPHTVLNAKQNESEAEIVSKAGEFKAITIATNMAGRGTDIKPDKKSLEVGGLFVIGTSKAESRRIDNQLRGRSGRQGDVGESQFFLSLDDKLISRFSNQEKLKKIFSAFGDQPITNKSIIKALKRAQVKIEGFNFDARKNVLQFDDVIRQQRDLVYSQRDIIISQDDLINVIQRMIISVVKDLIFDREFIAFKKKDLSIDKFKLVSTLNTIWMTNAITKLKVEDINNKSDEEMISIISQKVFDAYLQIRENVIENISENGLHEIERDTMLSIFDKRWQDHIDKMSKLKSSTSLSSYAQKNPFQVYVEKGGEEFKKTLKSISHNTIKFLMQNRYGASQETNEHNVMLDIVNKAMTNDKEKK